MNKAMTRESWFIALVLPSGWAAGWLLARVSGGAMLGPAALAVSLAAVAAPTILAFLLSEPSYRRQLRAQLFCRPPARIWAAAAAFPILLAIVGRLAAVATARSSVAWLPEAGLWKQALAFLPVTLVWGLLEEIGWRGFLTARVAGPRMRPLVASWCVGALWGLWHAPQMFFSDMPFEGAFRAQPWVGAILWTLACVGYGGVLGWLQVTSGSCLPPALCHALINIVGMLVDTGGLKGANPIWAGTGGLAATASALAAGIWLFRGGLRSTIWPKVVMGGLAAALLPALPAIGRLEQMIGSPIVCGFFISFALASMADNYAQLQWGSQDRGGASSGDSWPKKVNMVFLAALFVSSLERARLPEFLPRAGLIPWIGIACIAGATVLRMAAISALGQRFTSSLQIHPDGLVTRGVFSRLRHPSYLGALLLLIGAGLSLSSALGLVLMAAIMLPLVLRRIKDEELLLAREHGKSWDSYVARTRRLLPGLY